MKKRKIKVTVEDTGLDKRYELSREFSTEMIEVSTCSVLEMVEQTDRTLFEELLMTHLQDVTDTKGATPCA